MPIPGILMRPPLVAQQAALNAALLLHMDGVNGSTTFIDETGKTVIATGGAVISTAQSKFGGASALFSPGSPSDRLDIASSSDFAITTAYTAECWARQTGAGITYVVLQQGTGSADSVALRFAFVSGASKPQLRITPAGVEITGTSVSVGTWVHLAWTRSGTTFTFWQDGVSQGTAVTGDYPTGASLAVRVGDDLAGSVPFEGYIDEVRLSKVVRYSVGFTPSASAFMLD